jgi:trehalose 6-phosphate phosphatase
LLLDYDGTLAPLVEDPGAAGPHPDAPALLARLAERHPLVIVTGRDLDTLARLLRNAAGDTPALRAIGLHGAEEGILGRPATRHAFASRREALGRMRESVPKAEGVVVEQKGGEAFAVHYRLAPAPEDAHKWLEEWAAGAPAGLVPVWGKYVVELRPAGVSKGVAVAALAAEHSECTPVYAGDDTTNEEAFAALNDLDDTAVTVRVGAGATVARYGLPDVESVIDYLRTFDA